MTHADLIRNAIRETAAKLPAFDEFDAQTQQILLDLGEEYFQAEFVPRLEGIVNLPRYQTAMHENTEDDRAFIEDQIEFLTASIAKAQAAAHQQLREKCAGLWDRPRRKLKS